MTTFLAALVLAAPCLAQKPHNHRAPEPPMLLEDIPEAIKGVVERMAAERARAEAAKPKVKTDPAAVRTLVDRLERDGEDGATEDGWETKTYTENGRPDRAGSFRNFSVSVIRKSLPPPTNEEGTVSFTVMRWVVSHIQGSMQVFTKLPNGRAKIEQWDFAVDVDGTITAVQKTTAQGKQTAPDTIEVDPNDKSGHTEQQLAPSAPGVLDTWKTMERKFLRMGRLYEA